MWGTPQGCLAVMWSSLQACLRGDWTLLHRYQRLTRFCPTKTSGQTLTGSAEMARHRDTGNRALEVAETSISHLMAAISRILTMCSSDQHYLHPSGCPHLLLTACLSASRYMHRPCFALTVCQCLSLSPFTSPFYGSPCTLH